MKNSTKICKVCGKEYPYCKTELKDGEIFRWQDVACCPEHGSEYFALVAAARAVKSEPIPDPVNVDIEDAIDDETDDADEDEDEEEDEEITE